MSFGIGAAQMYLDRVEEQFECHLGYGSTSVFGSA